MRNTRRDDGSRGPFDPITILFHWSTATLILFQAMTGFAGVYLEGDSATEILFTLHRGGGALVWSATVIRFLWRGGFARLPAFPQTMPLFQRRLVTNSEQLLYAVLFLQPLIGFFMMLFLGRPFTLFMWTIPAILPRNIETHELFVTIHMWCGFALFALAGGHAFMGLVHHYVLRDNVLSAMAPWLRRRKKSTGMSSEAQMN